MTEVESISKSNTDFTNEESSVSENENDVLNSTDKENYGETEKNEQATEDDEMTLTKEKPEKGTNIGLAPPPPTNPWTRHLKQPAENGTMLEQGNTMSTKHLCSHSIVHSYFTAEPEQPSVVAPKTNSKRKPKVRLRVYMVKVVVHRIP